MESAQISSSAKIFNLASTPLTVNFNIPKILNLGASIVTSFGILIYR